MTDRMKTQQHRQSVDALMNHYVGWREACLTVASAYRNWTHAGRADQRLAFSEYIAALNCEEEAALVYQRTVTRVAAMNAS